MELTFTVFGSLYTTGKVPLSNNDEFHFKNIKVPFEEVHNLFRSNFVLSRPLIKDCVAKRDKSLTDIYDTSCGYCVLDFDDVLSEQSALEILKYFKNNLYSVSLFKSRSYGVTNEDGVTEYNLKGVMLIETESNKTMTQAHINYLSSELEGLCNLDISSSHVASYQAPAFNAELLLFQVNKCIEYDLVKNFIPKTPTKLNYDFDEERTKWFWYNMITKYNATPKSYVNSNGTINVSLPIEKKTAYSYFWNPEFPWRIQHPNTSKSIDMFNDFIKTEQGKLYIKEKNLEQLRNYFSSFANISITLEQNNRYVEVDNNIVEVLNLKDEVLMVKAMMGGGKSNIVKEYSLNNNRILYITMRKTLSYEMAEKYQAKHYLEHLSNTTDKFRQGDNLVVQVDSIHRINPMHFDTIVIDEFESMCLYTQSHMSKSPHYVKNMKILYELFESNKKFIIMDTFLNDFSANLYFKNKKRILVSNKHKDNTDVFVYGHKETFINVLENRAKQKNPEEVITCSFGTLSEMYAVKEILEGLGLKVIVISSETSDETKKLIASLFDSDEVLYDVLLYSPTITVGVSINNNIKHHFHYDTGKSIDAISSVQMLKRSRKASYIHVYLEGDRIIQRTFDVNVLNERTKARLNKLDIGEESLVFYNSDTNDLSKLGEFVNKFIAHRNFYSNNHKETIMYLLGVQFNSINIIDDISYNSKFKDTLKKIKRIKSNKDLFDGFKLTCPLDIVEYDEIIEKQNKTDDDLRKLILLDIKRQFGVLSDSLIVDMAKQCVVDKMLISKIKNLYFYTLPSDTQKNMFLDSLSRNQRSILDSSEFHSFDFLSKTKLQDFYTKSEVQKMKVQEFKKVGFKKKNGCLVLDQFIKKIVNELLKRKP